MLVSEVMKKEVLKMKPTESVQEAAKKMRDSHAAVAVIVEKDKVEGILTEGDLKMSPFAADDGNRCFYFSEVQTELLFKL